mmetsp:Transcript_11019/g.30223  ORF Transcript_11019/g.30223 Transcript_11019/m.30223 type:complete len:122 (-) Transcript_11019:2859-3224(-)
MASLLSLPDDLLGHIFSMLETCEEDGRDCRRSFLSCCKTLRASKSIHSQFSTLTISADQLSRSSSSSSSSKRLGASPSMMENNAHPSLRCTSSSWLTVHATATGRVWAWHGATRPQANQAA